MARVFLSYARDDAELAKQLAGLIAQSGHDVWWDRDIQGGSHFSSEIDKALADADAVLVLWTQASIKSAWVQDEAAEGRDSGRLVPATVNGVRPPLGFRQYQSIELGHWAGQGEPQHFETLLRAIEKSGETRVEPSEPLAAQEASVEAQHSICVLPFQNMSGEAEQEYFSDGISEDIITDLSNVSALSVVARNTSFTFKGESLDVKEVAQKLGVSHVLEGSVRKAGNRVRITAQLIDGAKGDHVWAARFDRDLTDIFAIQDEISKAIVDALKIKLLPEEKEAIEHRGTTNVDAYNIYLMARQQWVSGNFGDTRRDEAIVRLCEQATELDPNYAQAWALMALAQAELNFTHGKERNALPAAERAIELNPALPEAHCIKARYLEEEGRAEEAERQMRTAIKLDPESWEVNREAARMLFRHGHLREAIPFFDKAVSLMESDWHNPLMLVTCHRSTGDKAELNKAARISFDRAEKAIAKEPTNGGALAAGANALAILGDKDRALEWVRRALLLDPDNNIMRYNLGCMLIQEIGAVDEALKTFEPFFQRLNSSTHMRHIEVDPDVDPIRDDPRFKEMLAAAKERLGMTPDAAAAAAE
jgi:adenylate cyclase